MSIVRYELPASTVPINLPEFKYITRSKFEQDWQSTPHSHPFVEFAYIESGKGIFFIDSREYVVEQGNIVVIPANIMHTEFSSIGNPLTYYIIGVDNISISELNTFIYDFEHKSSQVHHFFFEIFNEMKEQKSDYLLLIQSFLLNFLVFLKRTAKMKYSPSSDKKTSKMCANIKDFLYAHYSEKISLATLSKKHFISTFHLVHQFTHEFGCSPIHFLTQKRLAEAVILLKTTEMSVTNISSSIGFSSASHFSQKFKSAFGISPLQVRKEKSKRYDRSGLSSHI